MKKNTKWILFGSLAWVVMAGFFITLMSFVIDEIKGEAYQLSLIAVRSNQAVISALGEPIEPHWFVMGNTKRSGGSGSANLEYTVEGTITSGTVYLRASRDLGQWRLDEVVLLVNSTAERIQVVEVTATSSGTE